MIFQNSHPTAISIYLHQVARVNNPRGRGYVGHRRQTVFARDDAAMRKNPALFHDHAGGGDEIRRPRRIGERGDENFAGENLFVIIRPQNHSGGPGDYAGRNGNAFE